METLFESYNLAKVSIQPPCVLALFASGRTSGLVVESGDGATNVVPVFEGYAMSEAAQ